MISLVRFNGQVSKLQSTTEKKDGSNKTKGNNSKIIKGNLSMKINGKNNNINIKMKIDIKKKINMLENLKVTTCIQEIQNMLLKSSRT